MAARLPNPGDALANVSRGRVARESTCCHGPSRALEPPAIVLADRRSTCPMVAGGISGSNDSFDTQFAPIARWARSAARSPLTEMEEPIW
jgi:hypothetical protein